MSDLSATNCGCNNNCGCNGGFFGGDNSCLWIILLLLFCGGCGGNGFLSNGNGCGCNDNNNSCGCNFIWILLLLSCCGGCGNGCGC